MKLGKLVGLFGGTKSEREVRSFEPLVSEINAIYARLEAQPDDYLVARLKEIQREVAAAREEAKSGGEAAASDDSPGPASEDQIYRVEQDLLEERLPEVFAIVKDACRRLMGTEFKVAGQPTTWDMIPFDVQLIGAIVLHKGRIAEMKTGEGKTLVATMPIVLNALTGRGVHIVTVNDYLAQRDSQWMGLVYDFLGFSIGCILNQMNPEQRREAYGCDITYGTNNEFGFDYLRDNMAVAAEDQVQRGHVFVIVDEVDSVLIDEARTPLIISGQVDAPVDYQYTEIKPKVERLIRQQTELANRLVAEAERTWDEEQYEAATKLLIASRGMPKHKRLLKMNERAGIQAAMRSVESEYIRDKRVIELDEELYFSVDEKGHIIDLTEQGRVQLAPDKPETFVIPDLGEAYHMIEADDSLSDQDKLKKKEEAQLQVSERSETIHHISQLLRAYTLYEKDVDYVVQDGKVLIVDEFTGRILPGRRYSDGLHQALEAKESVVIEKETQTIATITIQNYFRLYEKLAGMTGTAITEATEFNQIYKLQVTEIPTHLPVVREDQDDLVFKTKREKYKALLEEIERCYKSGQPALVGTISVEVSEKLSRLLTRRGIPHNVLNAKQHQREAEVVVRAGLRSAVTIATNMAGRGTDIKLGEGVLELGGLSIIGTERHESRRIDLQLRGRTGRQGDPGNSVFFLSLEDDLMRLFLTDRISRIMDRLGLEEGEVITHRMVTKSIERAQKRVEARNFGIRKHLLEYDNVMNQQREIIYDRRNYALHGADLQPEIGKMVEEFVTGSINRSQGSNGEDGASRPEEYGPGRNKAITGSNGAINMETLRHELSGILWMDSGSDHLPLDDPEQLVQRISALAMEQYNAKKSLAEQTAFARFERYVILRTIDEKWQQHLYTMDQLREGINLRAYGQKDPLLEYKSEAFDLFVEMLADTNRETLRRLFRVRIAGLEERRPALRRIGSQLQTSHADAVNMGLAQGALAATQAQLVGAGQLQQGGLAGAPAGGPALARPVPQGKRQPVRVGLKVGRNDPCPCGSGKKYKKCHGA